MQSQIIREVAKDLSIKAFPQESENQFVIRTIYSAMASWIKTTTFDSFSSDPDAAVEGISKRHIHDKCSRILDGFASLFPGISIWFAGPDNEIDPIACIRQRLIYSGDLVPVGFETNVALSCKTEHPLTQSVQQVCGNILDDKCFYSGVSTVCSTGSSIIPQNNSISSTEWLSEFTHNAWWSAGTLKEEHLEYFDAFSSSRTNHNAWVLNKPNPVSGLLLARYHATGAPYSYVLEKHSAQGIQHHSLDPFLQERREYRRIIFALRAMAQNPAIAKAVGTCQNVRLSLRTQLPHKEQHILEALAWPVSYISDLLNWDMPYEIWEYVKPILIDLGLSITEEIHG